MKYLFSFILFFNSVFLFSQQININVCNETSNIAARNNCVKGYVESLLLDELINNPDTKNISEDNPENFKVILFIDQIGNTYLQKIETSNKHIEKAFNKVLKRIRPLESFKNFKGEMLSDEVVLEFTFPIKNFDKNEVENEESVDESTVLEKEKNPVAFAVIENVPVFPGCYEESNQELKKCMSSYITKHVINNFNITIAENSELEPGVVRISTQFKINKLGYVVDVRARAPNYELESETVRVIKAIPRMTPGKQKGIEVGVLYSLPIIFEYVESPKQKRARLKKKRKKDKS